MQIDVVCVCVQVNVECVLQLFVWYGVVEGIVSVVNLCIVFFMCYCNDEEVYNGIVVSCDLKVEFVDVQVLKVFFGEFKVSCEVQVSIVELIYLGESCLWGELKVEVVVQMCELVKGLVGVYGMKIIGLYSIFDVVLNFVYGVQVGIWGMVVCDGFGGGESIMLDKIVVIGLCYCVVLGGELFIVVFIMYIENVYVIFFI